MNLQTSNADIRAGWRYFRQWKERFWLSSRRWTSSPRADDLIYLAPHHALWSLDYDTGELEVHDIDERINEKVAFMKAYLSVASLDAKHFEKLVVRLLKYQSRIAARDALGFWFIQSDMDKFDFGISTFFQGDQMNLFCGEPKQIDFATVSAILPFDQIVVRHPHRKWSDATAEKLVSRIKYDLEFDGLETDLSIGISGLILTIDIGSPDYGGEMNANRLRCFRAREVYQEIVGDEKPTSASKPKPVPTKSHPRKRRR